MLKSSLYFFLRYILSMGVEEEGGKPSNFIKHSWAMATCGD